MRICFATIPAFGHLFPLVPLAIAAQAAGHHVTVAANADFARRLPLPVVQTMPEMTLHQLEVEAIREAGDGTDPFRFPKALFGVVAPRYIRPRLTELWQGAGRPDLVVYEATNIGAAQAAADCGIPAVAFRIGMHAPDLFVTQMLPAHGVEVRTLINPVPASWSAAPVADEATRVIPIRTVPWSGASGAVPEWLAEASAGTTAYLTLGTVSFGAVEVLRRSILETAEHCDRLLVAAGPDGDPAALGELPAHVHVERFVDQGQVLPLVDIAIHHGGTGSVLGCLASGVRQVLTPQGADQFFNADRLTELQLGRVVRNDSPPGAVGDAVAAVLDDPDLGTRVRAIQAEIAAMPDPASVVSELESLA